MLELKTTHLQEETIESMERMRASIAYSALKVELAKQEYELALKEYNSRLNLYNNIVKSLNDHCN